VYDFSGVYFTMGDTFAKTNGVLSFFNPLQFEALGEA
jgi:hypothetical protein